MEKQKCIVEKCKRKARFWLFNACFEIEEKIILKAEDLKDISDFREKLKLWIK